MKTEGVVHGDLRPNNIMCQELPDQGKERGELEIKVIDFDWAGRLGVARYPTNRNPDIAWPGNQRDLIGKDNDKEPLSKTLDKLYSCGDWNISILANGALLTPDLYAFLQPRDCYSIPTLDLCFPNSPRDCSRYHEHGQTLNV